MALRRRISTPEPRTEITRPTDCDLARILGVAQDIALIGFTADGVVAGWLPGSEVLLGLSARDIGESTFAKLHDEAIQAELFGGLLDREGTLEEGATVFVQTRTPIGHLRAFAVTFARAKETESPVAWWGVYRERGSGSSESESDATPSEDRESVDRLRELLVNTVESLHNGLCILEMKQNRMLFANEAFCEITGLRRVELIGTSFDCSLAEWPKFRQFLLPHIEQLKLHGRAAGSAYWEVELPAGQKTLEVYGQPIFSEVGRPSFLLIVVEDITERQQLSTQLVQSEKLAAIGQLAAGIAHEIRSPLATIYNALYDLNNIVDRGNEDIREDIDIATEEIRRVQEIINNLLDFARDSGRDVGTTQVNETIERTLRVIQKDLQSQGIEIVQSFETLPASRISPNGLKQILINLFTNASQAMSSGGKLTVATKLRSGPVPHCTMTQRPGTHVPPMSYGDPARERRRKQTLDTSREHIVITVSDTGCGIPPEVLPMIFNPFFTTKQPGSGTGLGLSVVHSQVRDMGGEIYVNSGAGEGSTFTIKLPAVERESDDVE
jgi:PAS domain S-box-containing protein